MPSRPTALGGVALQYGFDPVRLQQVAGRATEGKATAEHGQPVIKHHGLAAVAPLVAVAVKGGIVAAGGRLMWAEIRAPRSWAVVSEYAPHVAAPKSLTAPSTRS